MNLSQIVEMRGRVGYIKLCSTMMMILMVSVMDVRVCVCDGARGMNTMGEV